MKILYDPKFIDSFSVIWKHISIDSVIRANKFKNDLKDMIEDISFMPYKYRKSIYFDDENIRDMIFKGYVTPYEIDKITNTITVLGITKYKNNL